MDPILKVRADVEVVEDLIPAHMVFLAYEFMQKAGWEIRDDVLRALNVACVAPLAKLDALSVSRCCKKADEAARSLMQAAGQNEPRTLLIVCCAFALTLASEGLIDPRSQASLVSLAVMQEVQEDEGSWGISEQAGYKEARKLLSRATLLGYYLKPRFAFTLKQATL